MFGCAGADRLALVRAADGVIHAGRLSVFGTDHQIESVATFDIEGELGEALVHFDVSQCSDN